MPVPGFEKALVCSPNKQKGNLGCYQKRSTNHDELPMAIHLHRLSVCFNSGFISYAPHLYWSLCRPVKVNAGKTRTAGILQPISDAFQLRGIAPIPQQLKCRCGFSILFQPLILHEGRGGCPDGIQCPSGERKHGCKDLFSV